MGTLSIIGLVIVCYQMSHLWRHMEWWWNEMDMHDSTLERNANEHTGEFPELGDYVP